MQINQRTTEENRRPVIYRKSDLGRGFWRLRNSNFTFKWVIGGYIINLLKIVHKNQCFDKYFGHIEARVERSFVKLW